MEAVLWDALGKKPAMVFGEEGGSAAIWMFISLIQRTILCFTGLDQYIPFGAIFAFPFLVQVKICSLLSTSFLNCNISFQIISRFLPFMKCSYPLLPVRMTESIMGKEIVYGLDTAELIDWKFAQLIGRISPSTLAVVVPAHFLGNILAVVVFKTIFPFVPSKVLFFLKWTCCSVK